MKIREYPALIKYMGSKSKIIEYVTEGIFEVYDGGKVCDLFAGSCSLSGAAGNLFPIISNDVQNYARAMSSAYLHSLSGFDVPYFIDKCERAIKTKEAQLGEHALVYHKGMSLDDFNENEVISRALIERRFSSSHHLFTKYYSGTWWSSIQCAQIDAIRSVIDREHERGAVTPTVKDILLSVLMSAMAYTSQGTGHYAQYRNAETESTKNDILIYRMKSLIDVFKKKLVMLFDWNTNNVVPNKGHKIMSSDYRACLKSVKNGTVYADPPYAFVHYSRFYHAIETLYLYDYPKLQVLKGDLVKGRYREERHQSPFSIRSQVPMAFSDLFSGVAKGGNNLVLSYSDTGLISIEDLYRMASQIMGARYRVWVENQDHEHMTMGRKNDRSRMVSEALIMAKKKL